MQFTAQANVLGGQADQGQCHLVDPAFVAGLGLGGQILDLEVVIALPGFVQPQYVTVGMTPFGLAGEDHRQIHCLEVEPVLAVERDAEGAVDQPDLILITEADQLAIAYALAVDQPEITRGATDLDTEAVGQAGGLVIQPKASMIGRIIGLLLLQTSPAQGMQQRGEALGTGREVVMLGNPPVTVLPHQGNALRVTLQTDLLDFGQRRQLGCIEQRLAVEISDVVSLLQLQCKNKEHQRQQGDNDDQFVTHGDLLMLCAAGDPAATSPAQRGSAGPAPGRY